MRILSNDYLSNTPGSSIGTKGGPPRFAWDFSQYVIDRGHEWIGVINNSVEDATIPDGYREGSREFHFVPMRQGMIAESFKKLPEGASIEGLFDVEQKMLEQRIREAKPDVIFLNGFSVFIWIFARAARECGIPVVMQHAGIFVREVDAYQELFSEASRAACAFMEQEATEHVAANVFLNESSMQAFVESLPHTQIANPHIIPLPHAGWPFTGVYTPAPHTDRVIGVVARWDRIKNHEAILAFAKEVVQRGLPWKVRVVTSIPDSPERQAFKDDYRAHIDVIPPMDRVDLRSFYQGLDALLLPSKFDTVGGVVMEALAEGKPTLISPQVGWVSEYLASDMQDWIVSFDDAAVAVERLEAQFTCAKWPELAGFASHVQSKHDPDAVYASYVELFTKLAS